MFANKLFDQYVTPTEEFVDEEEEGFDIPDNLENYDISENDATGPASGVPTDTFSSSDWENLIQISKTNNRGNMWEKKREHSIQMEITHSSVIWRTSKLEMDNIFNLWKPTIFLRTLWRFEDQVKHKNRMEKFLQINQYVYTHKWFNFEIQSL